MIETFVIPLFASRTVGHQTRTILVWMRDKDTGWRKVEMRVEEWNKLVPYESRIVMDNRV